MKKEETEYIAKCFIGQQVKTIHQHPTGLLQPIPIPEWKWDTITIYFTTGLRRTKKQNDSFMVVVDTLSKEAHFTPVKSTYKSINIVDVFMKDIFRLHGIPKIVITYQDAKFTSQF